MHLTLPHNEDAESGLLCSLVLKPSLLSEFPWLTAGHFYKPANGVVFDAFRRLADEERRTDAAGPLDFIVVKDRLRKEGTLDEVGGEQYLDEVWSFVPTYANWQYYLDAIDETHRLRELIKGCNDLLATAYAATPDTYAQALEVGERTLAALVSKHQKPARAFKDVVHSTVELLQERYENRDNPSGVRFGLEPLDHALGGLQPGDLCVIGAETSGGKSALAGLAMDHTAATDQPVVVFSLEMGAEQLVERLIARRGEINLKRLRSGHLHEYDFPRLDRAVNKIIPYPIVIEDAFRMNIGGMASRCRELHAKRPLGLVIVDYLQLVDGLGAGRRDETREREVAYVSSRLKRLAGELKIPVIALSQLNDDGKVRESRAIGHDADVILHIEDPNPEPEEGEPLSTLRNIVIKKQRNGPRGQKLPVDFIGEHMDFRPALPGH